MLYSDKAIKQSDDILGMHICKDNLKDGFITIQVW